MLYDDQAAHYDERVGIPADAAAGVASAIDAIVGLAPGTAVLEPGAGTGMVSIHLLRFPIDYVGFDRSAAMLDVFREKVAAADLRARLLVADANERWPVDDGATDVVLSIRSLHHIAAPHVVAELARVLRDGRGWLLTGRVRRDQNSVKAQMRRQMRRRLRDEGFDARSHDDHAEAIVALLEPRGAVALETVVAARWTTMHRPSDSLASWQGKEGLGAQNIPPALKSVVLDGVRRWAIERYGDLDAPIEQEEFFAIDAIRIGKT